jgi:hypothetical protein
LANSIGDKLLEFIECERTRYEDSNMLAFGVSQVSRYYKFLSIIYARYTEVSAQSFENTRRLVEMCKARGSGAVGPDLWALHLEAQGLQDRLHLELESFFMFGTVFLDRAACFIEWYFGEPPKGRINSHRQLKNKLSEYALAKHLTLPEGFEDSVAVLEHSLAEFRDKEIAHDRSPRSMYMTRFNAVGEASLSKSRLYPCEGDQQADAKTPRELIKTVEGYVDQLIALIEINRSKSRLPLKVEA